jgi:hypothetical protein
MLKRIVLILSTAGMLTGCAGNHSNNAGGASSASMGAASYSGASSQGQGSYGTTGWSTQGISGSHPSIFGASTAATNNPSSGSGSP